MDPRGLPIRLSLVLLLTALVAAGCTTDQSLDDLRPQPGAGDASETDADIEVDVDPPPEADGSLTGRVGLVVSTNSPTWPRLFGSASEPGVAVLFVQPAGPSEGSGIERGDVITEIDGEPTSNHERAVAQLRAPPGGEKRMTIVKPNGQTREITVVARDPGDVDLNDFLDPLLAENPGDLILHFLRAQTLAQTQDRLEEASQEIGRVLEADEDFLEALALRGDIRWKRGRLVEGSQRTEFRDAALQDWNRVLRIDPGHTNVLVARSQAQAESRNANAARRDARRAVAEDETLPAAHYSVGVAEFLLRRYRAAAEPARRSIELNPYDVRYYELLARIFLHLDRPEDAQRTVRAIIELVPEGPTRERLEDVLRDARRRARS